MWRALPGLTRWLAAGALACACLAAVPAHAATCGWADWDTFKRTLISADGRVIDASTDDKVTVSEGQAYGLFFALVANDRTTFDKLLAWTENNLAQGDLIVHLPAWIWGRIPADKAKDGKETWGVIDTNSASDADLWIAYTLLEAGRLWNERRFTALGTLTARRIMREETAAMRGLGRTVLPGPVGFSLSEGRWRVNPSYVPLQVMRRLAVLLAKESGWDQLVASSLKVILETAPRGFSPDWAEYDNSRGFLPDTATKAESAYNAIRVYLWAGTLAADDPQRARILRQFMPLADYVAAHGYPPERVDTQTGQPGPNSGNAGFSAAVAPYLAALGRTDQARAQAQRTRELTGREPLGYYSQALALFGLGHLDGLYRFAGDGALLPAWKTGCPAR
ncbi:cellulose synthase complex periplasmic endoglucanase BcsZ [Cupriavidus pinatubonensis]|uniref:cellulase n=1 Tax=Cupriavidus pinatubonensis TaxID=248026 RepID=A0ABM8WXU6_9BURK|nr:cellulose synthase complex periplasmic endoglucanase BcsZ [Cupriavidus pinatubonensis]CAG9172366.1 Endoglucanase [Cupriavidus pinatubonensis]